jgi:hypothetical protein
MKTLVGALAVSLVALAGCGGGGESASFDRATTEGCLRDTGYTPQLVPEDELILGRRSCRQGCD